ncbi:hypothetical protein BDV18DRAFT_12955 [Aspergillus unguis]
MAINLDLAFVLRLHADTKNVAHLGPVKGGASRMIAPASQGTIKGVGFDLHADLLPGAADRVLMDPSTKTGHVDVRAQARTLAGHFLSIRYTGIIKADEKSAKIFGQAPDAETTEYRDHYYFIRPVFETSDPDLKWVEETVFLGRGHFVVEDGRTAVEYEIYRVGN